MKKSNEMTVGLLKEVIKDLPDDMEVFVGCEGCCNYDFKMGKEFDGTNTFSIVYDNKLFIVDNVAIDVGNGDSI